MKKLLFGAILCIFFSCNTRKKEMKALYSKENKALIQEKNVAGTLLSVTYMPVHWERMLGRDNPAAEQEMSFKLNIVPPKTISKPQSGMVIDPDTLFLLLAGRDTIPTLFAQQVPNGNPGTAEYLVTFKRIAVEKDATLQLVFKDWVYTNNKLVFPFEIKNIKNIDSLSSRL